MSRITKIKENFAVPMESDLNSAIHLDTLTK